MLKIVSQVSFVGFLIFAFGACEHAPLPPLDNPYQPGDTTGNGGNDTTGAGGSDTTIGTGSVVCDPDTIYFQQMILPLLNSNCAVSGCHDPETAEDDVVLSDYQSIMATADVVPFQPDESDIIEVLFETDPEDMMPPPGNTPLTMEQKNLLIEWINQGALNNSCVATQCDTTNVSFSQNVFPIISNNCTGCHSGNNPSGDISLTNYNEVKEAVLNFDLLNSILWNGLAENMPKNANQLSDCQIGMIEIWINDGTPNN
jgi:mono/diheme cytochrome c family protein